MSESITVRVPKALKDRINTALLRKSVEEGRRIPLSDYVREAIEKSINDLENDPLLKTVSPTVKSKDKTDESAQTPA